MEYYSAVKKNEIALSAMTQVDLEDLPNKINQTEPEKHHSITLICGF